MSAKWWAMPTLRRLKFACNATGWLQYMSPQLSERIMRFVS